MINFNKNATPDNKQRQENVWFLIFCAFQNLNCIYLAFQKDSMNGKS